MSNRDPQDDARSSTALLEFANEAGQVVEKSNAKEAPADIFEFTQRLAFLLTVGYLTKEQAAALHDWFDSQGAMKLPDLPGPDGFEGPRMYELLATRIHFGPPASATGPENIFDDFVHAVTSVVDTVVTETIAVLQAGTALLQAGTELLHEVHAIIQEA